MVARVARVGLQLRIAHGDVLQRLTRALRRRFTQGRAKPPSAYYAFATHLTHNALGLSLRCGALTLQLEADLRVPVEPVMRSPTIWISECVRSSGSARSAGAPGQPRAPSSRRNGTRDLQHATDRPHAVRLTLLINLRASRRGAVEIRRCKEHERLSANLVCPLERPIPPRGPDPFLDNAHQPGGGRRPPSAPPRAPASGRFYCAAQLQRSRADRLTRVSRSDPPANLPRFRTAFGRPRVRFGSCRR